MAVNLDDIQEIMTLSGAPVREIWSRSGTKIWSSYVSVIYRVDADNSFIEQVSYGESCLSPAKSPEKEGYTFLGWREDDGASSEVLTELIASGIETMTLYAVFEKNITVTLYNNTFVSNVSGKIYYNNGNSSNAAFALAQADKEGWTKRGWSKSTAAFGSVAYKNNAVAFLKESITLYGLYQKHVSCEYNNNIAENPQSTFLASPAYYNSSGSAQGADFNLFSAEKCGFTNDGYEFIAWAKGSADGERYAEGDSVSLLEDTTFYALWQREQAVVESVNLSRDQQQGEEEIAETITSDYVTSVNISGTLKAFAEGDDYRCTVTLYINDTAIGEVYANNGTESISIDYDLAGVDGITIKLYVYPHSSDEGGGSFEGYVTYM